MKALRAAPRDDRDDDWLPALTTLADRAGSAEFGAALLDAVGRMAPVDHCNVFTFDQRRGAGWLLIEGRLSADTARRLAEQYTGGGHVDDPNYRRIRETRGRRDFGVLEFDPHRLPDDYRGRFFEEPNLLDKVSWIHWRRERCLYVNFYRLGDSGVFSDDDRDRLGRGLPLVSSLIALHDELLPRTQRTGSRAVPTDEVRALAAMIGRSPFDDLTPREREILFRVMLGYSSEAIGLDLGIATSTVITHRKRAYRKLGVVSQNELFAVYLRSLPGTTLASPG